MNTPQNFTTYQGDAALPIFTVVDQAGNIIDISTVSEIVFTAQRSLTAAPVLSKKKTSSQITFVTNGADGKFQVTIASADTAALSGNYLYQAWIVDTFGNQTTVVTGMMQVGRLPSWSYDPGTLGDQQVYQVRFFLGDTDPDDQQLSDEEIAFALAQRGNPYGATAMCALALKGKYSRLVSISADGMSQQLGQRVANYQSLHDEYQRREVTHYAMPFLSGVSVSGIRTTIADPDRVPDIFRIGIFDNPPSDGARPNNQPISSLSDADEQPTGFLF